jgi:hypothetical protein
MKPISLKKAQAELERAEEAAAAAAMMASEIYLSDTDEYRAAVEESKQADRNVAYWWNIVYNLVGEQY